MGTIAFANSAYPLVEFEGEELRDVVALRPESLLALAAGTLLERCKWNVPPLVQKKIQN